MNKNTSNKNNNNTLNKDFKVDTSNKDRFAKDPKHDHTFTFADMLTDEQRLKLLQLTDK